MKSISILFLAILSFSAAATPYDPVLAKKAREWVTSLQGTHHLEGDEECRSLVINEESNQMILRTATDRKINLESIAPQYYVKKLDRSAYQVEIPSGDYMGSHSRLRLTLKKDVSGNLASAELEVLSGLFYKTIFECQ